MSRQCSVSSCTQQTSGFSSLCELHKRTMRRHGHAEQKGVTVHELQPFIERVTARRAKNPASPTWPLLQRRWEALTGHAEATLQAYSTGAPAVSYERQTAEQLMVLRDNAPGDAVIDVALAMFAMGEQRPGRFKSDKAFGFQLSRRVRGLARVNAGSHKNARTGRTKLTYKDTPPRVLDCLAESLKVAFGVAGMRLAELEMKEVESMKSERQQLHEALKDLK